MILMNQVRRWQIFIFILMWTVYGGVVMLRRPLGLIKSDMESELSLTKYELGLLDTAFLLPYACIQTFLGTVGDHYGVRRTIGICLLSSAMSMITFSQWQSIQVFLVLLFINGASQSLVWPTSIKAIGKYFNSDRRNIVFGFYGTSSFAGGIVGTVLAVNLRDRYGWQNVYQIPSIIVACLAVLVVLCFRTPTELGMESKVNDDLVGKSHSKVKLSFRETLNVPVVMDLVFASFSINFVRYSLFMWLPMYLSQHLHYSAAEAGMCSTSFEIGGVIGSITIGFVIDGFLRGRCLLCCSLYILLSAGSLLLLHLTSTWGWMYNITFIFLIGVFNCGVDTIMTGSVTTELGGMDRRNAAAAISGVVNGFGKISTVFQGPMIGLLAELYGWSGVLLFLVLLSIIGSIVTYKASRNMQNEYLKMTAVALQQH